MCANYLPPSLEDLARFFAVHDVPIAYELETYPVYAAPFIVNDAGARVLRVGCFGLIPYWARDTKIARQTYNARSETVDSKPSFRDAWKRRQFALVPARAIFEPFYVAGKSVRWRIERRDHEPFAVAALWSAWRPRATEVVYSFSMLTVNAADNTLMQQFHAPEDEKRSVVVIEPSSYDTWLNADHDTARAMLNAPDPAEFTAHEDPRPRTPRARSTSSRS